MVLLKLLKINKTNKLNYMTQQEQNLRDALSKIDNKDFGIYFFTVDSHGNALAAIANIYEHVKMLNELGYKATILHEKNEYTGVADWLGEEYMELPHLSIESKQLNVGPQDFIVIPEVFSTVMKQVKDLPAKKVAMCQAYDYILELLEPGISWLHYGVTDAICTSEKASKYVKSLFPSVNTEVVPVSIPEYFKPSSKPRIPEVAILARDQQIAAKIIKSFYLQYPMYKWVGLPEVRGLSKKQVAERVGQSCLAVWVDDISGFGTFPLECMECETPIIGKVPNMIPEWMETTNEAGETVIKNNGIWTNDLLGIPELIAKYLQAWLEDNEPAEIREGMLASKGGYPVSKQKEAVESVYTKLITKRREEIQALADEFAKAEAEALANQGLVKVEK